MHQLPTLPYSYDALEPHIDARTMEIHHTRHHQTYVDKLNQALEKHPDLAKKELDDLLTNLSAVPDNIRPAIRNHGGGHANHSLFWTVLGPDGGGEPAGDLAGAIKQSLGSFAKFKDEFTNAALNQFGSGWAWLAVDGDDQLKILSTPNQDTPLSQGFNPILGLDVWEHSYYLKYENRRPDYVAAFWHVVNWSEVAKRYQTALR